MGGRGGPKEVSREGHKQQIEVKIITDQGRQVGGPNGVMEEHQVVSKKVSCKVGVYCCFISLLIAGIAFTTYSLVFASCTVTFLR